MTRLFFMLHSVNYKISYFRILNFKIAHQNYSIMTTFIKGTGTTLPALVIPNSHFLNHTFYDSHGVKNEKKASEIIEN